jgi:hypothetical protein
VRSVPELYERSRALLSEKALICVFTHCLSPLQLVKILNKIAGPPPGFRPESIPPTDIIRDALGFYREEPHTGHLMISALNKKTDSLAEDVGRIPAKMLSAHYPLRILRDMMRDFTIGRLIWALLRDERPEAEALLKRALSQVDKRPGKRGSLKKTPATPLEKRVREALWVPPAGKGFEERVKMTRDFLDDLSREYRSLFHQARRSEEKEGRAHEETKSARMELEEALREKNILSAKCRDLESRLHALEAKPSRVSDIEQKLKRVVKEKDKLEYEVAKMRRERESEAREMKALEQKMKRVETERDALASDFREARERESSLMQKIGILEKELGSLKTRVHAMPRQEPQKKREYREQRVGVFVDGLACYGSARALYGKKIDYRSLLEKVLDMRIRSVTIVYLLEADFSRLESLRQVLRSQGFLVKPMRIKWENEVMADIMSNIDRLDTVVTCTGKPPSSRFRETLGQTGKSIEIYAFERDQDPQSESGIEDISYFGEDVLLSS